MLLAVHLYLPELDSEDVVPRSEMLVILLVPVLMLVYYRVSDHKICSNCIRNRIDKHTNMILTDPVSRGVEGEVCIFAYSHAGCSPGCCMNIKINIS